MMENQIALEEFNANLVACGPNFFDVSSYMSCFMDGDDYAASDVYSHFLNNAHIDQRSPNPNFDAYEYLERYGDVRQDGMNAFLHYVLWGRIEGRTFTSAIRQPITERPVLAEHSSGRRSIAIVVHLYYEDYVTLLKSRLDRLAFQYDLFISCPNESIAEVARSNFGVKGGRAVSVEIFPNRGRNIAPLFFGFRELLSGYDIIGHVHTKKSLYTGSVKMDWAKHLLAPVVGSPEIVNRALDQFRDPRVAVVTSDRYASLPFWSQHVLKNEAILNELCAQLGLSSVTGFIDYPVGGMFWIRGDIYREISQLGKTFSDFPDEVGQTDGTLHHALERLIGHTVVTSDNIIVKYDPRSGSFYTDEAPWKHSYLAGTRSNHLSNAMRFDVVSFDLFDTLIMRDSSDPDAAKRLLGREPDIQSTFPDSSYVNVRNKAEFIARQKCGFVGDVGWIEIAESMTELVDVSRQQALSLLAREAELDLSLVRPRHSMVEFYQAFKGSKLRRVIVTDTYYPREVIAKILKRCAITMPDALYISSEIRMRKDRGDVWPHVRDIEGASIIHFGDNMVSDVQNANDAGINGQYILSPMEKVMWLGFVKREPDDINWPLYRESVISYGDDPFFG